MRVLWHVISVPRLCSALQGQLWHDNVAEYMTAAFETHGTCLATPVNLPQKLAPVMHNGELLKRVSERYATLFQTPRYQN